MSFGDIVIAFDRSDYSYLDGAAQQSVDGCARQQIPFNDTMRSWLGEYPGKCYLFYILIIIF